MQPGDTPFYLFFNAQEVEFIEAACERLIPADEIGPGAPDAWVPNYLDKQLGGAWGAGVACAFAVRTLGSVGEERTIPAK